MPLFAFSWSASHFLLGAHVTRSHRLCLCSEFCPTRPSSSVSSSATRVHTVAAAEAAAAPAAAAAGEPAFDCDDQRTHRVCIPLSHFIGFFKEKS